MPIYDYQCAGCGHAFDALQKLADKPLRDCPECGKPQLRKLISAPAVQVKGAGGESTSTRSGHSHTHDGHTHSHGPGHTHGPGKCGGH